VNRTDDKPVPAEEVGSEREQDVGADRRERDVGADRREEDGEAERHDHDEDVGAPAPRPRWRRLAPLVLVGGAVAALASLLPHWPHERQVEFRIEDPSTVVGLDVAWMDLEKSRSFGDTVQEGRWNFAAGAAPGAVVATVRLPDGNYEVDVTVKRADGARSLRRTVTLGDGERITVMLR
jgi:hypothetical protein